MEQNHEVTVLVRDPGKLGDLQEKLKVIQGDYFDPSKVTQAIERAEAVLSTIGPPRRKNSESSPEQYEAAMKNLIKRWKTRWEKQNKNL